MCLKSGIIHRLFWPMNADQRSETWFVAGAKLSLYRAHEKQCPCISDLPQ